MIVNETLKIIKQRRSIRSYKDEQITEEEFKAVLEAGLYAPDAGGQAWHFTVIQNKELLGRLNLAAKEAAKEWLKNNFKLSLREWLYNSISPNNNQRLFSCFA